MDLNSFSYSNSNSKQILDTYGINESLLNNIIYSPEFSDLKFISWDGTKLVNKNILPDNYKTCQNIVITKNIRHKYVISTSKNIESQSEIVIFLI